MRTSPYSTVTTVNQQNPYAPPESGGETSDAMAACPACKHRIGFREIAFAPRPIFLQCSNCNAELIGSNFVRLQAIGLVIAPLAVAGAMLFLSRPLTYQNLLVIGILALLFTVIFAIANVFATVYWGRYEVSDPNHK